MGSDVNTGKHWQNGGLLSRLRMESHLLLPLIGTLTMEMMVTISFSNFFFFYIYIVILHVCVCFPV